MYKIYFGAQTEGFKESLKILKQSKTTIELYEAGLKQFLNWLAGEKIYDLKEVTFEVMRKYQLLLLSKSYSLNTIHVKLRCLKRFFEYLEKTRVILLNPAEKIILPKLGDRLSKNILSEEEIKKLLNAPNTSTPIGIRDRALLELLYSTGIRKQECADLKVYDVDYKGGSLRINQGKGSKDRVVPLGKKACDALREYLLKIRPVLTKEDITNRSLFVSVLKEGKPLSEQSLRVIVKNYGKQAGIKQPVNPHAIRRSVATHLLKNDAHPLYIQRILGHSSTKTLNKYIKVIAKDVKKTHNKTHPREKDRR